MQSIDACFSLVIRCSLQIGAGLSEAREVRDLFIDIHEKILEPLHKADMTLEQAILLFQVNISATVKGLGSRVIRESFGQS